MKFVFFFGYYTFTVNPFKLILILQSIWWDQQSSYSSLVGGEWLPSGIPTSYPGTLCTKGEVESGIKIYLSGL